MHPERLFCIVGNPLSHSLSPLLHSRAFEAVGYPGFYMAFVQSKESLGAFFASVRSLPISGGNVTIPFKVDALGHMDRVTERAKAVGAMNTFFWKEGLLWGDNTDVAGFAAPLKGKNLKSALVLGAGGAARAVVAALKELGVSRIAVSNRTSDRALALAGDFSIEAVPFEDRAQESFELVVNATRLGMKGSDEGRSPFPKEGFFGRKGLAYDLVYTPRRTRFLSDAASCGWSVQSGVEMFVEQARESCLLWTGKEMPKDLAFTLVDGALS